MEWQCSVVETLWPENSKTVTNKANRKNCQPLPKRIGRMLKKERSAD